MSRQEQWFSQRTALLRRHLQELSDKAVANDQAQHSLMDRHQDEQAPLSLSAHAQKQAAT